MRSAATIASLLAGLAIAAAGYSVAAEGDPEPLFVNYGKEASPRQGDNDHHQAIYFSVPASDEREALSPRYSTPTPSISSTRWTGRGR